MSVSTKAAARLSLLGFDRSHYRDRRFWHVQGLVFGLAVLHTAAEYLEWSQQIPHGHALYFVPEALFLIPVGYAALNFGLHGAVATAIWSSVLILPNLFIFHHGREAAGVVVQLAVLNAVAYFGGQRVDREMGARRQIETARAALEVSELRFRSLFENSAEGVLVLDRAGGVHEANAAAAKLLGCEQAVLRDSELPEKVKSAAPAQLLSSLSLAYPRCQTFPVRRNDDTTVYLQPLCTEFTGADGKSLMQVSLRDVTQQHVREQGLRTFAAHILQAQEEERRRIAQELHDETLQRLVVLSRCLDTLEEAVGTPSTSVQLGIEAAHDSAHEVMASLRKFTRQLRPPALDELGVTACIRRMLADLSKDATVVCNLRVCGDGRRLSGEIELGLFRIVQEAVRNVERHADASQLQVSIDFAPRHVKLVIADNGKGFSVPTRPGDPQNGGLGLLGMQERAAMLGGSLDIDSGQGQGTTIVATVPA